MSRPGYFMYNVYVADGFYDDCEELIHRCKRHELLTYHAFCNIWKEMNFASMYKGRMIAAEIAELSEEVLHIAKQYMVADTSNYEESVAGVFLVYALLNLQPFSGFAALRLVPDDMPALRRLEVVSRREKRYDVLYILGAILVRGPRQCQAEPRERGMDASLRKYLEGYTTVDQQGIRPKGVFYRQNEELDIIRELKNVSLKYTECKAALSANKRYVDRDRNLSYSDDNLANNLQSSLKRIVNGLINDEDESGGIEHLNAVQAIKMKAIKNVNTMRHRIAVSDRSPSPKKKGKTEGNDNNDDNNKNSPSTSGSPRKRKNTPKKRQRSKKLKKIKYVSSDDSEELASDGIEETEIKEIPDKINDISKNGKETDSQPNIEGLVDIEIDTLPIFIKTAEGDRDQLIEIEFIDQYRKENDKKEPDETEIDIEAKLESLKDMIVTRIYDTNTKSPTKHAEVAKQTEKTGSHTEMAQISKIGEHVFKKPSKIYQAKLKKTENVAVTNINEDSQQNKSDPEKTQK